MNGLRRVDI